MSNRLAGTATVLLIGLALTDPALAQGRRDRSEGRRDEGRQAQPRGGDRTEQRHDGGGRRSPGGSVQQRSDVQPRSDAQRRDDNQPRPEVQPRAEAQPRRDPPSRGDSGQRWEGRSRSDNNDNNRSGWDGRYRDDDRRAAPRSTPYYRGDVRPRVVVPQYRSYGGYRSYPRNYNYVVPYGYRPNGYRPGWNFNLYFGRPYGRQLYGGGSSYYGGGSGYGYYSLGPGFAYGSLRIVDAPRYAQVFVDGYYAGEVDDYDGIFQRLNLEPGPHRIGIVIDESAPPLEFDVQIIPGETVTYRARF